MKNLFAKHLAVLSLLFLWGCTPSPQEQTPPNIIWIVSEDNSPLLGCYGDSLAISPNIDKLAKEGVLFENAFANAPVCAPSRATLITGLYPTTLGTQNMRCMVELPKSVKFFPQYLRDAGYFTSLRIKRDYNSPKQEGTWDVDDFWNMEDALKGREEGQPFFMFYNTWMSHEGKIQNRTNLPDYFKSTFEKKPDVDSLLATFKNFDSSKVRIPEYQPNSPEMRDDWAWYYKAMQMMDYEVGEVLKYLADNNLLENTIVIYSSDHGGVLGRSKRFTFESGLKIPMIIKFPENYKNLEESLNENRTDRIVSFVDMAPTILSLAGINKPDYMYGNAFLGEFAKDADTIAYGFRDRMDEGYDMVRSVRNKRFRYIRNYMPYRPSGQHLKFLWKVKSMRAWEESYRNGELNSTQSVFFEPKMAEEMYDIANDPDNINNIANNPKYSKQLIEFRKLNDNLVRKSFDTGFFTEGELWARSEGGTIPYKTIIDNNLTEWKQAVSSAEKATLSPSVEAILPMLKSEYPMVRYWGAVGSIILGNNAKALKSDLIKLLDDESGDVVATSAEALYLLGEEKIAVNALIKTLKNDNIYVQLRALNVIANRNITDTKLISIVVKVDRSNEYINNICDYILSDKS